MTEKAIISRWGNPILDDYGYVDIPGWIMRNYHKCGVSPLEMMFIAHVMAFKYDHQTDRPENSAQPSLGRIAGYMGRDIKNVRRIKSNLIKNKLLVVHDNPGKPDEYNFAGFTAKCLQYAASEEIEVVQKRPTLENLPRTKTSGVGSTKTPDLPRTKMPAEESEYKDSESKSKNLSANATASQGEPSQPSGNDGQEITERKELTEPAQAITPRKSLPEEKEKGSGEKEKESPKPKPVQPHVAIIEAWHAAIPAAYRPIGKPEIARHSAKAVAIRDAGITAEQVAAYVTQTYDSYLAWANQSPGRPKVMSLVHVKDHIKAWLAGDTVPKPPPPQVQQSSTQSGYGEPDWRNWSSGFKPVTAAADQPGRPNRGGSIQ